MNCNQREGEGREVQESFDALETKLRGQYRELKGRGCKKRETIRRDPLKFRQVQISVNNSRLSGEEDKVEKYLGGGIVKT